MRQAFAAACCALLLAACGSEEPEPEPAASPSLSSGPRKLVAANFDESGLGAKIEGQQGTQLEGSLTADGRPLAEIVSYVACPEGFDSCDPAELPAETVYTFVHRVTPVENIESATRFGTSRPAPGFANIGYSRPLMSEALGEAGDIEVSIDDDRPVWRIVAGDGWSAGEALLFFWQSTLAPEGPVEAYQLEADGLVASGAGPFPPEAAAQQAGVAGAQ